MESIKKISDKPVKDDKKKTSGSGEKLQQNLTIAIFLFIGGMLIGSKTPHLAAFLMTILSLMLGYISRDLSEWIKQKISK